MYPDRISPQFVHEIYSRKKSVNELLKRAISNAFRHGLNVRPGQLNNADGNCLWEALIYNILYRQCIKSKTKESHRQLRKRSLDKAQIDAQNKKLPFIPAHTTQADWEHIKKDKIYETELGDICLIAASRALNRDIMVFNTCKQTGLAPITLISA